jgi:23S rRNA (cytosine1962-C5)-methyltransferase
MYSTVELRAAAADKVRRGHPWVFKNGLARGLRVKAGTPVTLVDHAGSPLANGLADPESELAVRVYGPPEADFSHSLQALTERAFHNRQAWGVRNVTDAWRWLHGENDGLPGFIVDLYGRYAVVKLDAPYEQYLEPLAAALRFANPQLAGVLYRGDTPTLLWGEVPEKIAVEESGFKMVVEPYVGQKTGMFLDQRENRRWVMEHAAGQTVLNLFSYTGGFSLAAMAAGAKHVTSVDIAAPALATLEASIGVNGFDATAHTSAPRDCYDFLRDAARHGDSWDLIVLDPPSLAHSKAAVEKARQAYERLNTAAMRVLSPGGLLCTASCTSRITPEDFRQLVTRAAEKAERRFQIIYEGGAGADHPVALPFPEGRYLKFLALQG